MPLLEKHLQVKRSKLPKSGKGLFTSIEIARGTRILEYKGKKKTWKEITSNPIFNGYAFYINRDLVIDAKDIYEPWPATPMMQRV